MNPVFAKNLSALRRHHLLIYSRLPGDSDKNEIPQPSTPESHPESLMPEIPSQVLEILNRLRQGMDFLYWIGLRTGAELRRVAPEIIRENRGICIIEPSPDEFLRVMRAEDWREFLASQKIFWAVGETVREDLNRIWDESLGYAAAHPHFHLGGLDRLRSDRRELETLHDYVSEEIHRRKTGLVRRLRDLPGILETKREGPPRIWIYQDLRDKARYSLIQHVLIRTLSHHLRRLGYAVDYTVLHPDRYYPPYYRVLKMALSEPNLIFLCNEAPAYDYVLGPELSRSLPIPKVVWFADDPLYGEHLLLRHKITPDETYLIADYEWADPLKENGAERVLYMPGAATKIRRGKKRGSRACDVVFVGQVRDQRAFFEPLSPAWRDYCRRVIAEKIRFPRKKVREVMAQFEAPGELPADRMDEFRQKLLWEANTQFRLQVLSRLADFDLRIYGNEDWVKLLPPEIARRCFRGVLRFQHLFEVYRNGKITLNIHSLQSYTCMNVRDFDVPAAGGFLLSDWLPRAEEIYRPGFVSDLPLPREATSDPPLPEVFFYRSLPELLKLIPYFLRQEGERRACIERARRKVLAEHTYAHRAEWLGNLFERLLSSADSQLDRI